MQRAMACAPAHACLGAAAWADAKEVKLLPAGGRLTAPAPGQEGQHSPAALGLRQLTSPSPWGWGDSEARGQGWALLDVRVPPGGSTKGMADRAW